LDVSVFNKVYGLLTCRCSVGGKNLFWLQSSSSCCICSGWVHRRFLEMRPDALGKSKRVKGIFSRFQWHLGRKVDGSCFNVSVFVFDAVPLMKAPRWLLTSLISSIKGLYEQGAEGSEYQGTSGYWKFVSPKLLKEYVTCLP